MKNIPYENIWLKKYDERKQGLFGKGIWATTFTLSGTVIGAGILGLPYVFAKSGFLFGLFWLLVLGIITLYTFLCLGEISLRTKADHQLPGLAGKYLGKGGNGLCFSQ